MRATVYTAEQQAIAETAIGKDSTADRPWTSLSSLAYILLAILLPGGTLVALLLHLYRGKRSAHKGGSAWVSISRMLAAFRGKAA
jgi:hypothetical protein